MKSKKAKVLLLLGLAVVIIAVIAVLIFVFGKERYYVTVYTGENEHWSCSYTVYEDRCEETGLYDTRFEVVYKDGKIPAEKVTARLMHGNAEITCSENKSDGDGSELPSRMITGGATSGKPVYTMPLTALIGTDDGEYESVPLSEQKSLWTDKKSMEW